MARKASLRLVVSRDLPENNHDHPPARWQGEDAVFFHRSQVHIGTRIMCFGRMGHGEQWEVVEIKTYRIASTGTRMISRKVDAVVHLSDDVVIRRLGSNETRQVCFATLSYSAIWRLVP